jgi:maleylacetoacetate isomerase
VTLSQSLAIIDYLDAKYPSPRLIPGEAPARARVLEFALLIACDIHPVNNSRVLRYLKSQLGISDAQRDVWYAHWIAEGLAAAERLLERHGGSPFAFGAQPTLADCCLVPQVANALRAGCQTQDFSRVMSVYRHCTELPAFQQAAPNRQPDFVG